MISHSKLHTFIKTRLKNRIAMLRASRRIDEFRKKHGKREKSFDSVSMLRKMRDSRR